MHINLLSTIAGPVIAGIFFANFNFKAYIDRSVPGHFGAPFLFSGYDFIW